VRHVDGSQLSEDYQLARRRRP